MRTEPRRGSTKPRRPRPGRLGLAALVLVVGIGVAACVPQPPPPPPPAPANLAISGGSDNLKVFMPPSGAANDTYTVTNTGGTTSGALTGSLVNATGTGAFTIPGGTCGFALNAHPTLAPNASCTVVVEYTPAFVGDAGAVTLSVTGTPGGTKTRALTGEGVQPSELSFHETSHAFTDNNLPGPDSYSIVLSNFGIAPTSVDLSITGATGTGQFSLNPGVCTGGLAAGGNCTVTLFYENDTGSGTGSATLTATGDSSVATMSLTGTGAGTPNVLTATPPSQQLLDPVGGPATLASVTFTNTGSLTTSALNSNLANGSVTGNVFINNNGCAGVALAPGGTCTVELAFQAASATDGGTVDVEVQGAPGGYLVAHFTLLSS